MEFWENGKLRMQGAYIKHERSAFSIFCEYDSIGLISSEDLGTYRTSFNYPDATHSENCAVQHLPYQEGKFAHQHRIGKWCGYVRRAKKTPYYVLNYNNNGVLEGEVQIYDTTGNLINSFFIKNSAVEGDYTIYNEEKLAIKKTYKNGTLISEKKYDNTGRLLQEVNYGKKRETIEYAKNSNIVIKHSFYFDEANFLSDYKMYNYLQAPYILLNQEFQNREYDSTDK